NLLRLVLRGRVHHRETNAGGDHEHDRQDRLLHVSPPWLAWGAILRLGQGRICDLRCHVATRNLNSMPESVIDRDEVVSLLFNVSDMAVALRGIARLLLGDDNGEEEVDEG